MRIESGPTQFGQDWPGLFLRGDECLGYALALQEFLKRNPIQDNHTIEDAPVKGLLEMLRSPDTRRRVKVQKLKPIEKCVVQKPKGKPGVD